MDPNSSRMKTASVGKKGDKTRRTWSIREEQVLMNALKDIVARGWKCENGFKTGYLGILETAMAQAFPTTDLKADPHINSKIHVWKKNYASLSTMLSRSGFGWNEKDCTIDVESKEVWDNYVKTDSNARTMRFKSWPFYKDWCEVFGKDRATGENAEAFADAVQELFNKETQPMSASVGGEYMPYTYFNDDAPTDNMSVSREGSSTSTKANCKGKKRKSDDDFDVKFIELLSSLCEKTDARLGELVQRVGFEHDASKSRKVVFDALACITELSDDNRVTVARLLCNNTRDLDLFFSLSDEMKAVMVRQIVNGRM